jgi:ribonuclease Z
LPASSLTMEVAPVMFPPGRFKLATRPYFNTLVEEFEGDGVVYEKDDLKVIAFEVDHGDVIKPAYGYGFEYKGRVAVMSGDTRYNEKVIKYATGADLLIHEVAIVRSGLMSDAHVRRIMAHHTTACEAGMVYDRAKPKLAAFTHLVFLSSPQVPRASMAELVAEARQTYRGPLEVGEDLICFEIDETITVRRRDLQNLLCGKTTG